MEVAKYEPTVDVLHDCLYDELVIADSYKPLLEEVSDHSKLCLLLLILHSILPASHRAPLVCPTQPTT